jgi:hypothetical protein
MIRIFCDWCGKEQEKEENFTTIKNLGLLHYDYEVCSDCAQKIKKLRKEIKKLKKQK